MSLGALAARYGTDKAEPKRGFIPIYERVLEKRRNEHIRLLEIGVLDGASLRTWRDYLPNAEILGVDINPAAGALELPGVDVLIGSQADGSFLNEIADRGPFDVIIDDGSHHSEHQKATLAILWPALNPAGVYIVEDIHTSYLGRWRGRYRKPGTFVEHLKDILDDPNQWWHQQPPTLPSLESIQVYPELCVLTKETTPFRGGGGPDPASLERLHQPAEAGE